MGEREWCEGVVEVGLSDLADEYDHLPIIAVR
jgi:hypothetical protein